MVGVLDEPDVILVARGGRIFLLNLIVSLIKQS